MQTEYGTLIGWLAVISILATLFAIAAGFTRSIHEVPLIASWSSAIGIAAAASYFVVTILTCVPYGNYSIPVTLHFGTFETGDSETLIGIADIYVSDWDCYIETFTLADGNTYKAEQEDWIDPDQESRVQIYSDADYYIVATVPPLTKETLGVTVNTVIDSMAKTDLLFICVSIILNAFVFVRSMLVIKSQKFPEP